VKAVMLKGKPVRRATPKQVEAITKRSRSQRY
jgi:hypothetical protein